MLANIVKVHGFGRMQDLMTLYFEISRAGYSMGDVAQWIETKRTALSKKERIRSAAFVKNCPECSVRMNFEPVNTGPRDQTGDNATFVWTCPECGEQVWTDHPLARIINAAHRGRKKTTGKNLTRH